MPYSICSFVMAVTQTSTSAAQGQRGLLVSCFHLSSHTASKQSSEVAFLSPTYSCKITTLSWAHCCSSAKSVLRPHKPSLLPCVPGTGTRTELPYRARRQAHICFNVRLCLWLHGEFSFQDLFHGHVLVSATC